MNLSVCLSVCVSVCLSVCQLSVCLSISIPLSHPLSPLPHLCISGALQDIDQVSVLRSLCKETIAVDRVRNVQDAVCRAIQTACSGVPGPVFLELPVDVLYPYNTGN